MEISFFFKYKRVKVAAIISIFKSKVKIKICLVKIINFFQIEIQVLSNGISSLLNVFDYFVGWCLKGKSVDWFLYARDLPHERVNRSNLMLIETKIYVSVIEIKNLCY